MATTATELEIDHSLWKPKSNPWAIAATVALAAFMEVLDTSIANVALPHIAGSLGASTNQGTWVLTSYLVANAIILPVGAWASSVIGRRNFFQLCIVIFTVSSFLCGIAPTLPMLLIFRVFQGIGGGGLQPMAQAIMADSFEERKRGLAFSLYGLVAVLAPSIGPTLGGWITDNYSWRWIFYINIPVGLLALVLVQRLVQDPPWIKPDRNNLRRLDYVGLALLTISMAGLQIALDKGEENDWFASNFIRIFSAMFIIGIIALILWEWNHDHPIMNLKLFKFRNFAICCFLMLLVGGVLNASTVLQPQFLQGLLGYNATNAGKALTMGGLALVVVMPAAGIATGKFPARNLAALGFAFFAMSYWYSSNNITLDMSFRFASWLRIIQVLPIPFCFIAITNAAYVGLPREASNQVSRPDQLRPQRRRQHLHRRHRSPRHQPLPLSPGPPAGAHASRQSAVREPRKRSRQVLWQRRRRHLHREGLHLPTPQPAGRSHGLSGRHRMLAWMACIMVLFAFLLKKNRPGQGPAASEAMH